MQRDDAAGSAAGVSAVQVGRSHYRADAYDSLERWISYWYQARMVLDTAASTVLEIGTGTGTLAWYLRNRCGITVTTVDHDPELRPDIVADVRSLSRSMAPSSVDVVCAFQVLEHLPFTDFTGALSEMAKIARTHVLISLPENGHFLQLRLHAWRLKLAFGRKILLRRRRWTFDGEHHWEVGTRGHDPRRIRQAVPPTLALEHEAPCPDYPYHRAYRFRVASARPSS
jgi:hypothetical protein